MSIRAQGSRQDVRLSLKGAMAAGQGSGLLRRQVALALERGARLIEIDASGVRFMDAAGLGELVACRALARAANAELRLCGVSGKARELLLLTGLDRKLLQGHRRSLQELRFRIA